MTDHDPSAEEAASAEANAKAAEAAERLAADIEAVQVKHAAKAAKPERP